MNIDTIDRKILSHLQRDLSKPLEELALAVGLSRNAVWRRIRGLEDAGLIAKRVAHLDAATLGLPLLAFISVKLAKHDRASAQTFATKIAAMPEVAGIYRTAGQQDYLLKARLRDMPAYDRLYQHLVAAVDLHEISASFVMDAIKDSHELPL